MGLYHRLSGFAVATLCVSLWMGCSSGSNDEVSPAYLEVEPKALHFSAEKDLDTLLVVNRGGVAAEYALSVAAESNGSVWLEAVPGSGVLEGYGASAVSLTVRNRDQLLPGTFDGKLTVQSAGLDPIVILVSMVVGQPILEVDPALELDFGQDQATRNLIIKNIGTGHLAYTVRLPGPWVVTEALLQNEITSSQPQAMSLVLDRALVPWYGEGEAEILVTSNGQEDAAHSSTVKLVLKVYVDPSCEVDAQCDRPGYFCDTSTGEGVCTSRKLNGQKCTTSLACKSGFCVEGSCCSAACDDVCWTCSAEDTPGLCVSYPDGTSCEDGQFCTEGSQCNEGLCGGGLETDCSMFNTECSQGFCDEDLDGCVPGGTAGEWCVIQEVCIKAGMTNPAVACLHCDPGQNETDWSPVPGTCRISEECYFMGETVGADCEICNPASPGQSSLAADGTPCSDDGVPCTVDVCQGGECSHNPVAEGECDDGNQCTFNDQCQAGECHGEFYSCDDGLTCTQDMCNGKGGCGHQLAANTCLIEGQCHEANAALPDSSGCLVCLPGADQGHWSAVGDGTACDDQNACTLLDHCVAGGCSGQAKSCDDQLFCTTDICDPAGGECTNVRDPDWCIIDGVCAADAVHPGGANGWCLVCNPYADPYGWQTANDGLSCDDGLACTDAPVCEAGACVQKGPLCDDGNPCTWDGCGLEGECTNLPLEDGAKCPADQIDCTEDVCLGGNCLHPAAAGTCYIDGECYTNNEHHPDHICALCKAAQEPSKWLPQNDGIECDDGQSCTLNDTCAAGECSGTPMICQGTVCRDSFCSEELGKCAFADKENGVICSDLDPCTGDDVCLSGDCSGVVRDCSAELGGNPCQIAWCNPSSIPVPGKCEVQVMPDFAQCDDGLFCTVNELCQGGDCAGESLKCEAPDCHLSWCNEATDECVVEANPAVAGVPCDDSLTCTTDSVCQGDGSCGAGQAVSSGVCEELIGNENPCQAANCVEGIGCQLLQLGGGAACPVENGKGICTEGGCILSKCNKGWADCDDLLGTGCETEIDSDPGNCGQCNKQCGDDQDCLFGACVLACEGGTVDCAGMCKDLSADVNNCGECGTICAVEKAGLVGVCDDGCGEVLCPAGAFNADLLPGNGCEYECTITNDGDDICDTVDNNCDGKVDEDFDLLTDVGNCGICLNACGPYPHAVKVECVAGECGIAICDPDWEDADGSVETGCEKSLVPVEIWVDMLNAGDPFENGTPQHPYGNLDGALAQAEGFEVIRMLPGTYLGPFEVAVPGLVLRAENAGESVLANGSEGVVLTITADGATVQDLKITSGRVGIRVDQAQSTLLTGLIVQSQSSSDISFKSVIGIEVVNSISTQIKDCEVSQLVGADGPKFYAIAGQDAVGIWVEDSPSTHISGCTVKGLHGGHGGTMYTRRCPAGVEMRPGYESSPVRRW